MKVSASTSVADAMNCSPMEKMILEAIFSQLGITGFVGQTRFLLEASIEPNGECLPQSREDWKELSMLAQGGPPRSEWFYRWAAAMLEWQEKAAREAAVFFEEPRSALVR